MMRRDKAERESDEKKIKTRTFEFAAKPRDERQDDDDGDQLERVGVFAEKTEPDEQPGRRPKAQEAFGVRSSASQKVNMAATQKKIESGSIVMTRLPTLKIGTALSAMTAQKPARSLNSRRVK